MFNKAFNKYVASLPPQVLPDRQDLLVRFISLCEIRLLDLIAAVKGLDRSAGFAAGLGERHGTGFGSDRAGSRYADDYVDSYLKGRNERGMLMDRVLREIITDAPDLL